MRCTYYLRKFKSFIAQYKNLHAKNKQNVEENGRKQHV